MVRQQKEAQYCAVQRYSRRLAMIKVNHPDHYKSTGICGLEAIDIIDAYGLNFALGNALKYILRAGKKHDTPYVEDLSKAVWYLQHEISARGGETQND